MPSMASRAFSTPAAPTARSACWATQSTRSIAHSAQPRRRRARHQRGRARHPAGEHRDEALLPKYRPPTPRRGSRRCVRTARGSPTPPRSGHPQVWRLARRTPRCPTDASSAASSSPRPGMHRHDPHGDEPDEATRTPRSRILCHHHPRRTAGESTKERPAMTPPDGHPWTAGHWAASGRCALCAASRLPPTGSATASHTASSTPRGSARTARTGFTLPPERRRAASLSHPPWRARGPPRCATARWSSSAVLPFVCIVPEARNRVGGAVAAPRGARDSCRSTRGTSSCPRSMRCGEHQVRLAEGGRRRRPRGPRSARRGPRRRAGCAGRTGARAASAQGLRASPRAQPAACPGRRSMRTSRTGCNARSRSFALCALMVLVLAHPTGSARRRSVTLRTLLAPPPRALPGIRPHAPGRGPLSARGTPLTGDPTRAASLRQGFGFVGVRSTARTDDGGGLGT